MLLKFDKDDKSWLVEEMNEDEADELLHIGKNAFLTHMATKMFAQMAEKHGLDAIPKEEMFTA